MNQAVRLRHEGLGIVNLLGIGRLISVHTLDSQDIQKYYNRLSILSQIPIELVNLTIFIVVI